MKTTRAAVGVFLILSLSDAFFWHSRDWNSSSRLMLTYALVDRGTVRINGLEDHTRDRARLGDRYYSDKQPGFSFLATLPYALGKSLFGLPSHPLERKGDGFTHWASDYWIALTTSGLATAVLGAILTTMAADLGCGPRRSALVGLAYGLTTPAYVYATLNYGHQVTAACLLTSLALIRGADRSRHPAIRMALSGAFAAMAAVVELQAAPASTILLAYAVARTLRRELGPGGLLGFLIGAAIPTLAMLAYNASAFGSPFDMGYFHEDLSLFRDVHNAKNPLGLRRIAWDRAGDLLWREHRGLLVFAPILVLAPLGWFALLARRRWGLFAPSLGLCAATFLVNLSYPEWTGGWSTGPRLLVPMLPFAMIPVAAALAYFRRWMTVLAVVLACLGGAEMLMFQGVGGRVPPAPEGEATSPLLRPLREVVWPLWRGDPIPRWWIGPRFDRTILTSRYGPVIRQWPAGWQWAQFSPLILFQIAAISLLFRALANSPAEAAGGNRP